MAHSQSASVATLPAVVHVGVYRPAPQHALEAAANQAVLGGLNHFAAALYSERRFGLQEISLYHIAVAQPVGDGAFGMHLSYSGNADYNASKIGAAYGRQLGKAVQIGVQFNHWNQYTRGYGGAAQVTVEGGLLVHFSEVLHAGIQASNPFGILFQKWDQKRPAVYTIGVGYQPSQHLLLTAEVFKTAMQPVALQTGIEYRFTPALWCTAGINSSTAAFFIAAGFQLTGFRIMFAGSVHPQLGFSPAVLLAYNAMEK